MQTHFILGTAKNIPPQNSRIIWLLFEPYVGKSTDSIHKSETKHYKSSRTIHIKQYCEYNKTNKWLIFKILWTIKKYKTSDLKAFSNGLGMLKQLLSLITRGWTSDVLHLRKEWTPVNQRRDEIVCLTLGSNGILADEVMFKTSCNTNILAVSQATGPSHDLPGFPDGTAQHHAEDHAEDLRTWRTHFFSDTRSHTYMCMGQFMFPKKALQSRCKEIYTFIHLNLQFVFLHR